MARPSLNHCLDTFERNVRQALEFNTRCQSALSNTTRILLPRDIESVAGLTLVRIHFAWEHFLNDTFLRYLCGSLSPNQTPSTLLQASFRTISAAGIDVRTNNNGDIRPFVLWNLKQTKKRANKYFANGAPFSSGFSFGQQVIIDMYIIRNHFVHKSDTTQTDFQSLVRKEVGSLSKGMTPGRFLLRPSNAPNARGMPNLSVYAQTLRGVAKIIVP